MKSIKRILALLLCICMMGSALSTAVLAGTPDDFHFTVDKTTVEIGDEVTVAISNDETAFSAITLVMKFDNTILQCTGLENVDGSDGDDDLYMYYLNSKGKERDQYPDAGYVTVDDINDNSQFQFLILGTEDVTYLEGNVVIFTFKAIKEGTVNLSLKTTVVDENGEIAKTVTHTVTVNAVAPSCDHANTKAVPNGNGTHKIVCANEGCDHVVKESENCSGGTADCENAAICVSCKAAYGEAKGHGKTDGFRYVPATADTHSVICNDCDKTVNTVDCDFGAGNKCVCGNEKHICADHLTKTDEVAATCGKDGVKAYWTCECGNNYADDQATKPIADLNAWKAGDGKINATGEHVYVPGEPTWSADNKACTIVGKCGCGAEITANATVTEATKAGDCQTEAVTTYTATFTESWIINKTVTKVVEGEKNPDIHIGELKTEYINNGADHTVKEYYPECGDVISENTVAHEYGENHKCVCGAGFTGWDDGAYYKDGAMLTGWNEIEGDWYYLDTETGIPAKGINRVPYPTGAINGVKYAPNAEDKAYWEAHKDGSKYTDAETAIFIFGADGKLQQTTGLVDDGKRYAVNGMIGWHPGLVEVDGVYYYFVGDEKGGGNIAAEGDTYVTRLNNLEGLDEGAAYNFTNGQLSGIEGVVDGKYYVASKLMSSIGLTMIGDDYIYVRSNGQIATGKYWVTKTNGYCNPGMYDFGEDGYLQSVKGPNTNGIVDGVYYKNGMPYYAGLIEIDGKTYYVNSSGKVVTGKYYVTKVNNHPTIKSGDLLVFGENGAMEPIKNGIVDGKYYEKNHLMYGAGVVELTDENGETFYIYVRSNGELATGLYWPTTLNGYLDSGEYDWGTDGRYYPSKG